MDLKKLNFKLIVAAAYLSILITGLYYLFSVIDLKDLNDYEFYKSNQDLIYNFKEENFLFFAIIFFIVTVIWNLFLGMGTPAAIAGGFIFGKWLGTFLVVSANTVGAALIYLLARSFLKEFIEKKFSLKFSKFIFFFNKNDLLYFMCFRFIGGGGTPFAIQNLLPVIFNMPIKKYFIATFVGIIPTTFVTVALGSGIASVIDKHNELSFLSIISSPEIYLPLIGFFILVLSIFVLKKILFK